MANKRLVNQYKAMYQQINQITPQVYAALSLALNRFHGWEYEQIAELIEESQIIWQECVDSEVNMIKMCEEETGIEVLRRTTERME